MYIKQAIESLPWREELITIRKVVVSDAQFVHDMDTDIRVRKYLGILNNSAHELEKYISEGRLPYLIVEDSTSGMPIGYTAFIENSNAGGMDILICFILSCRKNGYPDATLNLMARKWRKYNPDIPITISTSPGNTGAIKLLERCGFSYLKNYEKIPGFGITMNVYVKNED